MSIKELMNKILRCTDTYADRQDLATQLKIQEDEQYDALRDAWDRGLGLELALVNQHGEVEGWSCFNPDNMDMREWHPSRFRVIGLPQGRMEPVYVRTANPGNKGGAGPDELFVEIETERGKSVKIPCKPSGNGRLIGPLFRPVE